MREKLPPRQQFSIPNSWIGRVWLWYLRRSLNRSRYTVVVRGRRAKSPRLRGYGGDIRLKNARRLSIYLNDRFRAAIQGEFIAEYENELTIWRSKTSSAEHTVSALTLAKLTLEERNQKIEYSLQLLKARNQQLENALGGKLETDFKEPDPDGDDLPPP